jgi:hypothetical protein
MTQRHEQAEHPWHTTRLVEIKHSTADYDCDDDGLERYADRRRR